MAGQTIETGVLIKARVEGQGQISGLSAEVENLAGVSDEAAAAAGPLARELQQLAKQQAAQAALVAVSEAADQVAKALANAEQAQADLSQKFAAAESALADAEQGYRASFDAVVRLAEEQTALKTALAGASGELDAAADALKAAKAEMSRLEQAASANGSALGKARQSAADYADDIQATKNQIAELRAEFARQLDAVNKLGTRQQTFATETRNLESAYAEAQGAVAEYRGEMDALQAAYRSDKSKIKEAIEAERAKLGEAKDAAAGYASEVKALQAAYRADKSDANAQALEAMRAKLAGAKQETASYGGEIKRLQEAYRADPSEEYTQALEATRAKLTQAEQAEAEYAKQLNLTGVASAENQRQTDAAWKGLAKTQDAITEAESKLQDYRGEMGRSNDAARQLEKSERELAAAIDQAGNEVKSAGAAYDQAQAKQAGLKAAVQTTGKAIEQANADLSRQGAAVKEATSEYGRAETALKLQTDRTAELGTKSASLAGELDKVRNRAKAAGLDTENLTRNSVNLSGRLAELKQRIADTSAQHQQAAQKAKENAEAQRQAGRGAQEAAGGFDSLKQAGGLAAIAMVAKQMFDAATSAETLSRGLTAATGSAEAGADALQFVRAEAQRLGVGIDEAGRAYVGLAAAARGAGVSTEDTRQIFSAVAGAMGALGKSTADTEGALQAVGQMLSKGTVSAEELRGQLGERLPGAMSAAARAAGVTEAEFSKMLESGQILAKDFLPKFAEELQKMGGGTGEIKGLSAEFTRLMNTVTAAFAALGNAGGGEAATEVFRNLREAVAGLGVGLAGVTGYAKATIDSMGVLAAALATGNWADAPQALRDEFEQAAEQVRDAADSLYGLNDAGKGAASGLKETATAAEKAADASQKTAAAITTVDAAIKSAAEQNKTLGESNLAAAEAAQRVADASGNEAAALAAAVEVAQRKTDLAVLQADAEEAQLTTARQRLEALQAEAKAVGGLTPELAKKIEAAAKDVQAMEAQLEASDRLLESQRDQELRAKVAAEMYGDQSNRVKQLAAEYQAAQQRLKELNAAQELGASVAKRRADAEAELAQVEDRLEGLTILLKAGQENVREEHERLSLSAIQLRDKLKELEAQELAGKEATQQVADATEAAKEAKLRYADALQDVIKALELERAQQQRDHDLNMQIVEGKKAQQEQVKKLAEARQDEVTASRAAYEIARLEADQARITAADKEKEARNALDAARRIKEALILQAGGVKNLTAEQKDQIAAAEHAAKMAREESYALNDAARAAKQMASDVWRAATSNDELADSAKRAADEAARLAEEQAKLADQQRRAAQAARVEVTSLDDLARRWGIVADGLGEYAEAAAKATQADYLEAQRLEALVGGGGFLEQYNKLLVETAAAMRRAAQAGEEWHPGGGLREAVALTDELAAATESAAERLARVTAEAEAAHQGFVARSEAIRKEFEATSKAVEERGQASAAAYAATAQESIDAAAAALADAGGASERALGWADSLLRRYADLDGVNLSNLSQALERVRQQQMALLESAKATREALQDQLDEMDGNQAAIEERRYAGQVADLEAQLAEAKRAGQREAETELKASLKLAEEFHKRTIDRIKADADQAKTNAEAARQEAARREEETIQAARESATAVDRTLGVADSRTRATDVARETIRPAAAVTPERVAAAPAKVVEIKFVAPGGGQSVSLWGDGDGAADGLLRILELSGAVMR
jgi:tape measure domain-containing protein